VRRGISGGGGGLLGARPPLSAAGVSGGSGAALRASAQDLPGVLAASKHPSGRRALGASTLALPAVAIALFLACTTGLFMLAREYGMNHVMLDEDQLATGAWIREHVPPKAVVLHNDIHITPSGSVAGRPSLVAYSGWMWSHGLPYGDRDRDRQKILQNALKDADPEAYGVLRRWGVRYVIGEHLPVHHRPSEAAHNEAQARQAANPGDASIVVPRFNANEYLGGQLKAVFRRGRYIVLEVQGYGYPPS
jgi:hypothetical protein